MNGEYIAGIIMLLVLAAAFFLVVYRLDQIFRAIEESRRRRKRCPRQDH